MSDDKTQAIWRKEKAVKKEVEATQEKEEEKREEVKEEGARLSCF